MLKKVKCLSLFKLVTFINGYIMKMAKIRSFHSNDQNKRLEGINVRYSHLIPLKNDLIIKRDKKHLIIRDNPKAPWSQYYEIKPKENKSCFSSSDLMSFKVKRHLSKELSHVFVQTKLAVKFRQCELKEKHKNHRKIFQLQQVYTLDNI